MKTSCIVATLAVSLGLGHASCVPLVNPSFDQDTINGTYQYRLPTGWSGTSNGVVISQSGNSPWGGLNTSAPAGSPYYLVLQGMGASVYQSMTGLIVGRQYFVNFYSAERPGYLSLERLSVSVGNNVIVPSLDPFESQFFMHRVEFVATSTSMILNFTNVSPSSTHRDNSVFLDAVSVCPAPASCVPIHNPDFEHDAPGVNYQYQDATGWTSTTGHGVVIAANNNTAWGGLDSHNGAYYLVLQRSGSGIQQQVANLTSGATYNVSFLAAERPNYGVNERLLVLMNNVPLKVGGGSSREVDPDTTFRTYWATFVASQYGRNLLSFENGSPNSTQDRSVFLDGVQLCRLTNVPIVSNPGCVGSSSSGGAAAGGSSAAVTAAVILGLLLGAVLGLIIYRSTRGGGGGGGGGSSYKMLSISAEAKDASTTDDVDGDDDAMPIA